MPTYNQDSPLAFVAIQAALKAGNLLKKGFGTEFKVSSKSNANDLVTAYDNAAEETIIEMISSQFPGHSFLAEESGETERESAVKWIIDPLDGTMNFAHQIPLFAVSIAALVGNELELGIIYQPMADELYIAQRGRGAFLNGTRLQVSKVTDMQFCMGATGLPYYPSEKREQCERQIKKFLEIMNPIRIIGSATMNMAYIAAGRFDVYWGPDLKPWDVAAGKLLVQEAGGMITNYEGKKHDTLEDRTLIASNGLLHEHALAILQ